MKRERSVEWECVGWAPDFRAQGEEGEVADQCGGRLGGVVVEYAIVRLGLLG